MAPRRLRSESCRNALILDVQKPRWEEGGFFLTTLPVLRALAEHDPPLL